MTMTTLATQVTSIVEEAPLGEVALPTALTERVVYTKFESQNPMISDTQHGSTWNEQFVASSRMGINEDHGVIIDFQGTPRGEVGITAQGEILEMDATEIREQALGMRIPRYIAYDFRIHKMTKTDGPARREKLQMTHEQQREHSEARMADSIANAFIKLQGQLMSQGVQVPQPKSLVEQLAELAPEQRMAMLEMSLPDPPEIDAEDSPSGKKVAVGRK